MSPSLIRSFFRSKKWWAYHPGDTQSILPEKYPVFMTKGEALIIQKNLENYTYKYNKCLKNTQLWYEILNTPFLFPEKVNYPLLCVPTLVKDREKVLSKLSRYIEISDWFYVFPYGLLNNCDFRKSNFPNASRVAEQSICLPTHHGLPSSCKWYRKLAKIITE